MIKTYTITVNETEQTINRTNTGFSTIELLGLLTMAKESLQSLIQANGLDITKNYLILKKL